MRYTDVIVIYSGLMLPANFKKGDNRSIIEFSSRENVRKVGLKKENV